MFIIFLHLLEENLSTKLIKFCPCSSTVRAADSIFEIAKWRIQDNIFHMIFKNGLQDNHTISLGLFSGFLVELVKFGEA